MMAYFFSKIENFDQKICNFCSEHAVFDLNLILSNNTCFYKISKIKKLRPFFEHFLTKTRVPHILILRFIFDDTSGKSKFNVNDWGIVK